MRFALFNSRKPRRVSPLDRWVRLTAALAQRIGGDGHTLVAGLGPLPCDLAVRCSLDAGGAVEIHLDPEPRSAQGFLRRHRYAEFLSHPRTRLAAAAAAVPLRPGTPDRNVCSAADVAVVVAARADGTMESLGRSRLRDGRTLLVCPPDGSAGTAGNARLLAAGARTLAWAQAEEAIRQAEGGPTPGGAPFPALGDRFPAPWPYVVHFTRACPAERPGQSRWEFVGELAASRDPQFHGGLRILECILREGRLRAGGRLIRGGFPVVSFTAAPPADVARIARWARHLGRWTFEPYGVGLSRRAARRHGLRPVEYGADRDYARLAPDDRWRFQAARTGGADWTEECEWRARGDVDLRSLRSGDGIVVVPDDASARELLHVSPFPILVLDDRGRSQATTTDALAALPGT